jgi:hypothetical protein
VTLKSYRLSRSPVSPQEAGDGPSPCPTSCVGIARKPAGCEGCPYRTVGKSFVADDPGVNPSVALLLETPSEADVLDHRPLSSRAGQTWLRKLVYIHGKSRSDLLVANTLRCCAPEGKYPIGKTRKDAEKNCRLYDESLVAFNPNLFLVTIHPGMLLRSTAMLRIVQGDLRKAFTFAERGYRPLVLMGDKAMHLVGPWLQGGVKQWRGTWWTGKWGTAYD